MPRLATTFLLAALLALAPHPGAAQDDGSAGAAVVGGLVGGAVGLWTFYPLTGCPMITVGAAREADACDAGGAVAALGGLGTGIWVGLSDRGAGYGMGVGALAGFGTGWLLNRVWDAPRWVDATLILAGTVAGGIVGADDGEDGAAPSAQAPVAVPLWRLGVG